MIEVTTPTTRRCNSDSDLELLLGPWEADRARGAPVADKTITTHRERASCSILFQLSPDLRTEP